MKIGKVNLDWDGAEWGEYHPGEYQFYIYWKPNWLRSKELRHLWIRRYYYDGPHISLGFWFFSITWSAWRSLPPIEMMSDKARAKWLARNWIWRAIMGL